MPANGDQLNLDNSFGSYDGMNDGSTPSLDMHGNVLYSDPMIAYNNGGGYINGGNGMMLEQEWVMPTLIAPEGAQ